MHGEPVRYVQGDSEAYPLTIKLFGAQRNCGENRPYALQENSVAVLSFSATDSNGATVYFRGLADVTDAQNGRLLYNIAGSEIYYPGTVRVTVTIQTGEERLTWPEFSFEVIESLDDVSATPPETMQPWTSQADAKLADHEERITVLEKGGTGGSGEDGHSPYIGANGNWFEWSDANGEFVDTGVKAKGEDGEPGPKGDKGDTGEQGLPGEKGDKGDKGDTGEQGLPGDTGTAGPKGDKGDKGDQGVPGEKGEKGDTGSTGPAGATGPKGDQGIPGDKGDKGDQGVPGPKGDTGATGAKGDKGDTGASGSQGPQGPKGDTGATGLQGPKGDKGDKGDTGTALPYLIVSTTEAAAKAVSAENPGRLVLLVSGIAGA